MCMVRTCMYVCGCVGGRVRVRVRAGPFKLRENASGSNSIGTSSSRKAKDNRPNRRSRDGTAPTPRVAKNEAENSTTPYTRVPKPPSSCSRVTVTYRLKRRVRDRAKVRVREYGVGAG